MNISKTKPQFGLKPEIITHLKNIFYKFEEIESVVLYGSRAKGNYHRGSDIDITLKGNDITEPLISSLEQYIDDLLLPYSFDISSWNKIDNLDLRAHIERVGVTIYQKI